MKPSPDTSLSAPPRRSLERFVALMAVAVCLLISLRIDQVVGAQQTMWPLPGLYLLEMLGVTAMGAWAIWHDAPTPTLRVGVLAWIAVGLLLGFAVMGAWSIGFLYLPSAALLLLAAMLSDRKRHQHLFPHAIVSVMAAMTQALLMLAVIRLLYPEAIF